MISTMARMRTTCQIPTLIENSQRTRRCGEVAKRTGLSQKNRRGATQPRSIRGRVDEKVAWVQLDLYLLADLGLAQPRLPHLDATAVGEAEAQQVDRTEVALDQHLGAEAPTAWRPHLQCLRPHDRLHLDPLGQSACRRATERRVDGAAGHPALEAVHGSEKTGDKRINRGCVELGGRAALH